jgi:hypothetical protein
VIDHCLEKNAGERFQSASDAAFALENLSSTASAPAHAAVARRPAGRAWLPWAVAALLAVALATLVATSARRPAVTDPPTRLSSELPDTIPVARIGSPARYLAIAPDGRRVVYMGSSGPGRIQLYLRSARRAESRTDPGYRGRPPAVLLAGWKVGGVLHLAGEAEEGPARRRPRRSRSPAAC